MSEYYKSLISDEEVIKELIKESKRREGTLPTESSRLKPNLSFFQRTVSSLVLNNTRIDKSVDSFRTDYLKGTKPGKYKTPVYKYSATKKPLIDYQFEKQLVLQTKINFVKAKKGCRQSKGKSENGRAAALQHIIDDFNDRGDMLESNVIEVSSDDEMEAKTNKRKRKRKNYLSKNKKDT